jgi:hypothetical protein
VLGEVLPSFAFGVRLDAVVAGDDALALRIEETDDLVV